MDKQNIKRSRATNFSFTEKELLLKLALQNKNILENKESNSVSWKDRNKCWSKIADQYNSSTTGCARDATSLRLKYEGIKKLLRGSKSELFKTGGGPHKSQYSFSSEFEKELYQVIQLSVEGLPCISDSDGNTNSVLGKISEPDCDKLNKSLDMFSTSEIVIDGDLINETTIVNKPSSSLQLLYDIESDIDMSKNDPSMSSQINSKPSWTPMDTTKLLNSTAKDKNLQSLINETAMVNKPNSSHQFYDIELDTDMSKNEPSTTYQINSKPSWTPMDSTKLLNSTIKDKKLQTNSLKRKNKCQASTSDKFVTLAEKKLELVEYQSFILKTEHEENIAHLKAKHALELRSLELDIAIKTKMLKKND